VALRLELFPRTERKKGRFKRQSIRARFPCPRCAFSWLSSLALSESYAEIRSRTTLISMPCQREGQLISRSFMAPCPQQTRIPQVCICRFLDSLALCSPDMGWATCTSAWLWCLHQVLTAGNIQVHVWWRWRYKRSCCQSNHGTVILLRSSSFRMGGGLEVQ